MHGFDYTAFFGKSDLERAKAISGGVDFLQAPEREEPKKLFIKEALLLRQALSLCQSLLNYEQRLEAAYFEAVRTLLTRIEGRAKCRCAKSTHGSTSCSNRASRATV